METRVVCDVCNQSMFKQNLRSHLERVHLKMKRYFCPQDGCDFKGYNTYNVKVHMEKFHSTKLPPPAKKHKKQRKA